MKIYSNIKFHKIRPVEAQFDPCGRTDRQTDMTKLIVAFCNFANASKDTVVHLKANHSYVRSPFLTLRPRYFWLQITILKFQQHLILGLCKPVLTMWNPNTLLSTVVMKHRP